MGWICGCNCITINRCSKPEKTCATIYRHDDDKILMTLSSLCKIGNTVALKREVEKMKNEK